MSQEEINKLVGGFEKMTKQWQDAVVDTWGSMAKQVVGSEEFSKASAEQMDFTLAGQKRLRDNSAQFLDSLEIPKRSDLARLSKQISSAESRLADCEGILDKILAMVKHLDARLEGLGQAKAAAVVEAPALVVKPAEKVAEIPAPKAAPKTAKAAGKVEVAPAKKASKPVAKADTRAKTGRAAAAKNAGRAAKKPK